MKHIFTLILSTAIVTSIYAQGSLKILKDDGSDISGTEYTITGDAARYEVKKEFWVVWEGSDSAFVGIKRTEMQIIPNTADYFCWVTCYAPKDAGTEPIWIAADSLWVQPNDTARGNFSVYINPKGILGIAKYRYVFAPFGASTDTTFVDVVFDIATVGIEDHEATYIQLYPNPAGQSLNINFDGKVFNSAHVRLVNIEGKMVMNSSLNNGNNELDVANLNRGIYIVEVIDGNNKLMRREKILLK